MPALASPHGAGLVRRARRVASSPLAPVLAALAAGLVAPSARGPAPRDALLGCLVLAVAVGIAPSSLLASRRAWRRILAAVVLPLATLVPLALVLGLAVDDHIRLGVLAIALASTEVAVAGFVAVAGGSAPVALATIALSLATSAVAAPVLAPLLGTGGVSTLDLVGRFGLVVLVPLAAGLLLRGALLDARIDRPAERAGTVVLALLVYAAVSGVDVGSGMATAAVVAAAFLAGSVALARFLRPVLGRGTGDLCFAFRDFAVAAALAAALGGPAASIVPALYGPMMLVAAAAMAARSRGTAAG